MPATRDDLHRVGVLPQEGVPARLGLLSRELVWSDLGSAGLDFGRRQPFHRLDVLRGQRLLHREGVPGGRGAGGGGDGIAHRGRPRRNGDREPGAWTTIIAARSRAATSGERLGVRQLLEQRELEARGRLEPRVERAPRRLDRRRHEGRAALDQARRRRGRIGHLEGDPDVARDPPAHLDLVDPRRVRRVRQLERRVAGVEDRHPAAGLVERPELRRPRTSR